MKKTKKARGRPRTTMTKAIIEQILRMVAEGMWPDQAARACGVSASTMRSHRERHTEFETALGKAEAEAESGFLKRMFKMADTTYQACAFLMERRFPERWAKREPEVQVNIDNRTPPPEMGPDEDKDWPTYFEKLAEVTRSIKPIAQNGNR